MRRNISRFALLLTGIMASCMLNGCFTGIESTPRISDKDVRRQTVETTAEDRYLEDVTSNAVSTEINPGKPWIVVDSKISLVLDPSALQADLQPGDTLRFVRFNDAVTVAGRRVAELELEDSKGRRFSYRTTLDSDKVKQGVQISIPFTVDLDMVKDVRDIMLGKTYYITTRSRYDMSDNVYSGRKFVPVKVTEVNPGNEYYPVRLTLQDDSQPPFRLYMSVDQDSRMPRKFSSLFSLSDPRLRYNTILPERWEMIINGKVAQGMTRDECRLSLGAPDNVDRQAGYSILREIWTYANGRYLVFSDGVLETFRL